MNLTKEQKQAAKELLSKLTNLYSDRVELDILKIDRENSLREELASACDMRNKQGEILPNKIKMPLVSALIDEIFLDKQNKKEEEYVLMDIYRQVLSNGNVSREVINGYMALKEGFEENNQNIKEVFKESAMFDKEILDAVNYLAKEKYKELLNAKKIEMGIEVKESKDISSTLEIIQEIKEMIGE